MSTYEIWTDEQLDEALTDLGRAEHDDGAHALAAGRAVLMAAATRVDVAPARPPVPVVDRRWSPRRLVAAAAAVGTLAAGGLVAGTMSFGDGPARNTAVAATLDEAAIDALGVADQPVGPGQYRYVRTRSWYTSGFATPTQSFDYRAEGVYETWAPANERDEWLERRDVTGAREWLVGSEEGAVAAGFDLAPSDVDEGEFRAPCGDYFADDEPCGDLAGSWQNPTRQWQAGLPTDPRALFDRLRDDAPDSDEGNDRGDIELLVYAADALRSGLVTADVRAAIYRALTYVPSLHVVETAANLDGRTGVALGVDDGQERQDIILDPDTGQFIGERIVVTGQEYGYPVGTVTTSTSVTTDVVDEQGVRPAG